MPTISSRDLRKILRRLGFKPSVGGSDGHQIWKDRNGVRIRPVLRKHEVHIAVVYSLGRELESKGVCNRRNFLHMAFGEGSSTKIWV